MAVEEKYTFQGFTAEGYKFSSDDERMAGMITNGVAVPSAEDPTAEQEARDLLETGEKVLEYDPAEVVEKLSPELLESSVDALPFVDAVKAAKFLESGLSAEDPEKRAVLVKGVLTLGMLEQEAAPRLMARLLADESPVVREGAEEAMSLISAQAEVLGVSREFVDAVRLAANHT